MHEIILDLLGLGIAFSVTREGFHVNITLLHKSTGLTDTATMPSDGNHDSEQRLVKCIMFQRDRLLKQVKYKDHINMVEHMQSMLEKEDDHLKFLTKKQESAKGELATSINGMIEKSKAAVDHLEERIGQYKKFIGDHTS